MRERFNVQRSTLYQAGLVDLDFIHQEIFDIIVCGGAYLPLLIPVCHH